jgi:integrase
MGRRKRGEAPQMRFHAHSGQARVRIDGKVLYLGPWDSPEAKANYHRCLVEWHTKQAETTPPPPPPPAPTGGEEPPPAELTVAELCLLWIAFCQKKFTRKDGTTTSSIHGANTVVRALEHAGAIPAATFRARALVTVQERLVAEGRPRETVNRTVKGIRRLFRWAVMMEHVPSEIITSLEAVDPLRKGQTDAPELPPVTDVSDEHVAAALVHLQRIPRDLVKFIRLVGCRPGEACKLRPRDVDTSTAEWRWDVHDHKTSWRGHERTYWIGPQAQAVLRPYLSRRPEWFCFSPAESERERAGYRRRNRRSPMTPSQASRTAKPDGQRRPKTFYTTTTLRRAIKRACAKAKVPDWSTMQLRHTAGTEAREHLGLDAAQARLGHRQADVTQVYASVTDRRKREVARLLG